MTERYTFISGASSGIGSALAHKLTKLGRPLLLTGRDPERLEALQRDLGTSAHIHQADLATLSGRQSLLQWLSGYSVDTAILNAGCGLYGSALDLTWEEQQEILDVNLVALTQQALFLARRWREAGQTGTLLTVASALAFLPCPSLATYAAAKSYVLSFSQSLAFELRPQGIRVLISCPGQVATRFAIHAARGRTGWRRGTALSPEAAADRICHQLESGRSLDLFGAPLIRLARILPARWVMSRLQKSIQARLTDSSLTG